MSIAAVLFVALLLDAALGEPRWIWERIPHPAVAMGRLIHRADTLFNRRGNRLFKGGALVAALVFSMTVLGWMLSLIPVLGPVFEVLIAAILLAQRSLTDHVRAVASGLDLGLREGRVEVAKIVGRDTREMTTDAVSRAAIESAAENFSDGVVAPVFWFLVAGLPGILVYKIVNTADSMIGYRTPAYEKFGKVAARLDDVMNYIPARASALLIALCYWRIAPVGIAHDASLHRSPNAGWPEAAMARALGVALAGPRSYEGVLQHFDWVNDAGRRDANAGDIRAAVWALWRAWAVMVALIGIAALMAHGLGFA